ncbi:MAG: hypothetical protein M1831_005010 [Alyxoria varia]|nr:MAG: hypothetical protein M1831_005010 [Alyxoria varia]
MQRLIRMFGLISCLLMQGSLTAPIDASADQGVLSSNSTLTKRAQESTTLETSDEDEPSMELAGLGPPVEAFPEVHTNLPAGYWVDVSQENIVPDIPLTESIQDGGGNGLNLLMRQIAKDLGTRSQFGFQKTLSGLAYSPECDYAIYWTLTNDRGIWWPRNPSWTEEFYESVVKDWLRRPQPYRTAVDANQIPPHETPVLREREKQGGRRYLVPGSRTLWAWLNQRLGSERWTGKTPVKDLTEPLYTGRLEFSSGNFAFMYRMFRIDDRNQPFRDIDGGQAERYLNDRMPIFIDGMDKRSVESPLTKRQFVDSEQSDIDAESSDDDFGLPDIGSGLSDDPFPGVNAREPFGKWHDDSPEPGSDEYIAPSVEVWAVPENEGGIVTRTLFLDLLDQIEGKTQFGFSETKRGLITARDRISDIPYRHAIYWTLTNEQHIWWPRPWPQFRERDEEWNVPVGSKSSLNPWQPPPLDTRVYQRLDQMPEPFRNGAPLTMRTGPVQTGVAGAGLMTMQSWLEGRLRRWGYFLGYPIGRDLYNTMSMQSRREQGQDPLYVGKLRLRVGEGTEPGGSGFNFTYRLLDLRDPVHRVEDIEDGRVWAMLPESFMSWIQSRESLHVNGAEPRDW